MDRTKLSAAREADFRSYRDYDDSERQRRQAERDRYQHRKLKTQLRESVWGDK